MNAQKWILTIVVVTILIISAYFIGKNSNSPTQTSTNTVATEQPVQPKIVVNQFQQNQTPLPQSSRPLYYTPMTFSANAEAQRNSYVNGCISTGGNSNFCNCSFDYLIYNYGVIWLINENAYIDVNGASSPELRSASQVALQRCSIWSN